MTQKKAETKAPGKKTAPAPRKPNAKKILAKHPQTKKVEEARKVLEDAEKSRAGSLAPGVEVVRSASQLANTSAQRAATMKKVNKWKPARLFDISIAADAEELAALKNNPKISIEDEQEHWALDVVSGMTTMMVYLSFTEETIEEVPDTTEVARFEKEIDDLGL
jgi:hypothetical protein